jgi:hypothetical protein
MRSLCIVATLIAFIASPAFARSAGKAQTRHPSQATSHDVYVGQRRIGTDPDPNVRFEMMRQDNWRKGG